MQEEIYVPGVFLQLHRICIILFSCLSRTEIYDDPSVKKSKRIILES